MKSKSPPFFKVRVSDLSLFVLCNKRSRLQGLKKITWRKKSNAMWKGINMHWEYSSPYKSFTRRLLIHNLSLLSDRNVFQRKIDTPGDGSSIIVRGIPDDYRILTLYTQGSNASLDKVVSIIEVKTTGKDRLWISEENVAIFQLQLYIWIMEPYLKKLGYCLAPRHYVEIYSQKDGKLMKRIKVESLPNIEKKIKYIIASWYGLEKISYPPYWICKRCPRSVKEKCWRYLNEKKFNKILH